MTTTTNDFADLAGRVLIASLFLLTGLDKITGYAGTQGYMASAGVPGALLPLVIALEVGGALALIVGYRVRLVAGLLAAFSVATALLFHGDDDPMQRILRLKDFAIAGGLLLLVARGAGEWSLDARRERLTGLTYAPHA